MSLRAGIGSETAVRNKYLYWDTAFAVRSDQRIARHALTLR